MYYSAPMSKWLFAFANANNNDDNNGGSQTGVA
jgi:hypothetical protein